MIIGKPDLITSKGPTATAAILHAVAILMKQANDWDWFLNLNAWDYPLVSQDDLLHIFSYLPRDLNFLEHTSDIGWKEHQRARPIIIDPGLYHAKKSGVFWAKEKRSMPSSFKLFTAMCARFRLRVSGCEYLVVLGAGKFGQGGLWGDLVVMMKNDDGDDGEWRSRMKMEVDVGDDGE
ncbi:Beta-glucuronosyltransferase GlcAT14C [Bienertia sinuspersici]